MITLRLPTLLRFETAERWLAHLQERLARSREVNLYAERARRTAEEERERLLATIVVIGPHL